MNDVNLTYLKKVRRQLVTEFNAVVDEIKLTNKHLNTARTNLKYQLDLQKLLESLKESIEDPNNTQFPNTIQEQLRITQLLINNHMQYKADAETQFINQSMYRDALDATIMSLNEGIERMEGRSNRTSMHNSKWRVR